MQWGCRTRPDTLSSEPGLLHVYELLHTFLDLVIKLILILLLGFIQSAGTLGFNQSALC